MNLKQIKGEFLRRKKRMQKQKQRLNRRTKLECELHSLIIKKEGEEETYLKGVASIKSQLQEKQRKLQQTKEKIEDMQSNASFIRNPGRKQQMQLFRIYQSIQKLKDEMVMLKRHKIQLDKMYKLLLPAIDTEICKKKDTLESFDRQSTSFNFNPDDDNFDISSLEDEADNNQNPIPKHTTPIVQPNGSTDFNGSNSSSIMSMLKAMVEEEDCISIEDSDEEKEELNGNIPSWFCEMNMFESVNKNK